MNQTLYDYKKLAREMGFSDKETRNWSMRDYIINVAENVDRDEPDWYE